MEHYENQLVAIMRCLAAENPEERSRARQALRKMLEEGAGSGKKPDIDRHIREALLDLGVPDHLRGHPYLVCAITMAVNDPEVMDEVTTTLYPGVARAYDSTAARVERAIRHAIEVGWIRGDLDVLQQYFGNTVSAVKGKPTNSEFIARVASVVRQRIHDAA